MSKTVIIREGKEQRTFTDVKRLITSGNVAWIPEDEAEDTTFVEENAALWGYVDLSNTQWELGTPYIAPNGSFTINFTSNGNSYTGFYWTYNGSTYTLTYSASGSPTMVFANGMWSAEGYKQMSISGGTDENNPELLLWLFRSSAAEYTERETFDMNMNILGAIINEKAGASGAANLENLIIRAQSI